MKESKKNKSKKVNYDNVMIAEEMSKRYLQECQDVAFKYQQEAKSRGLSSLEISGSLFVNHSSIAGSLMVSALMAQAAQENMENVTITQVLAFLKYYQKEMVELSRESYFEGLKKNAGIDVKKLVEDEDNKVDSSSLKVTGGNNSGGMVH
jgi:hypothetical protein